MQLVDVKNPKLGYYQVGKNIFTSKVQALIDATQQGIHAEWKFNNEVFDHIDWSQEPQEPLQELYRQRAQQIRDQYDYLILLYSGGSDSQNILDTFLKNNIKIDEIVTCWGDKVLENTYIPNTSDCSAKNILSEWDFVIKPRLEELSKTHPEIKITIHDWVSATFKLKVADDYILDRNHNFAVYTSSRWNVFDIPALSSKLDKHTNTGIIIGCDKPRICINDDAYRLYFLDIIVSNAGPQYDGRLLKEKMNVELFYWSPDSWKILAKQAHSLIRFFEAYPMFQQYIQWPILGRHHRQFYEGATRAIIYPDMDLRFFQVEKPHDLRFSSDEILFRLGMESAIRGQQTDNFNYLEKVIDKKYFTISDGQPSITGLITGMWKVKDYTNYRMQHV